MPSPIERKVWLVTGSSSGLGKSMCEFVLSKGDIVIATLRKPSMLHDLSSKYSAEDLLVLSLDVTDPARIISVFNTAIQKFRRIDVVFNNAGTSCIGEFESTPDHVARRLFEVNFWGATNVARQALSVFREMNRPQGGYLITISSMGALEPKPCFSYYAASKFALNGALEALSMELVPEWNIKSTIVDLGGFQTEAANNLTLLPTHPAYNSPNTPSTFLRDIFKETISARPDMFRDVNKAAVQIYKLLDLPVAPLHLPMGPDAVESAARKGNLYLDAARQYAEWSTDLEVN